jgi:hypothetical protein
LSESSKTIKTITHNDTFIDAVFSDEEEMGEEERLY